MSERSIFAAALDIADPAARSAYLDNACAGDPALCAHIDGLLAEAGDLGSFLARPHPVPAPTVSFEPIVEGPGSVIGRYKLLQPIGEGGFGSVYMAEQREPVKRRVALKIIKLGMDTKEVVARFEAERQALALMDHPNIAKVLDAGSTDTGRPFFVMELVKGVPITEFCDANHLPAADRLKLFVQVCQAVQHAHQKGIIHRDLKPSNVLVTLHDGTPVPKVIDFGVAKALNQELTERTLFTAFGHMIGTPQYMSPEQAEMSGLDVDTRSDVYSLGVLLFELLTGTTPLEGASIRTAGYAEMQRLIKEQEAPRPSQRVSTLGERLSVVARDRGCDPARLGTLLRGELDWIVLRALEKERGRRYESASGFAADVQRYLGGEPVQAVPPSAGYRARKFVRKHRAAVLVGGAFAGLLLAAAGVSLAFGVSATRAEADAVAARNAEAEQRDEVAKQRDAAVEAERKTARQRDETDAALARLRRTQDDQQTDHYLWAMQMVPLAFDKGSVADVRNLLDRHLPKPESPDRRAFEWHYWDRQLNSDLLTEQLPGLEKNSTWVWAASPDGTRLARLTHPQRGARSPVLTVWDTDTRKELLRHTLPIEAPAAEPGQLIGSRSLKPCFSPDGRRVAVEWGYTRRPGPPPTAQGVRLCQVIDVETKAVLLSADAGAGSAFGGRDVIGTFSRDGRRFASELTAPGGMQPRPGGWGGSIAHLVIWDLDTGKEVGTRLEARGLNGAAFHPDGETLVVARPAAAGAGSHISVWDAKAGKASPGWDCPEGAVVELAVSPDGARVAAAVAVGKPARERLVKVWDLNTGKESVSWAVPARQSATRISRLFFSRDGTRLVANWSSDGEYEVAVLDVKTGTPYPAPRGPADTRRTTLLYLSPDGRQLVSTGDNVLRVWDADTGNLLRTLRGHEGPVAATGFSPSRTRLWSVEGDGLFKAWDLAEKPPATIPVPGGRPGASNTTFAVSPDGSRVIVVAPAAGDGKTWVRVYDAAGTLLKSLAAPARGPAPQAAGLAHGLALSRDGRRVLLTRGEVRSLPRPKGPLMSPLIPQPATLGSPDLTVWDADSGDVLDHRPLDGAALFSVNRDNSPLAALSSDGRVAAIPTAPKTAGGSASLRVFDIEGKRERPPLALPDGVNTVAAVGLSPDGTRAAAAAMSFDSSARRGSAVILVGPTDGAAPFASSDLVADVRMVRGPFDFWAGIAWRPDGSRFALGYGTPNFEDGLAVYDAGTARLLVPLERPIVRDWQLRRLPNDVAYSPDGDRIAAIMSDSNRRGLSVKVWDAASGKDLLTLTPRPIGSALPGGAPSRFDQKALSFGGGGRNLLLGQLGMAPSSNPDEPDAREPAVVLQTWDAAPRPQPKKP